MFRDLATRAAGASLVWMEHENSTEMDQALFKFCSRLFFGRAKLQSALSPLCLLPFPRTKQHDTRAQHCRVVPKIKGSGHVVNVDKIKAIYFKDIVCGRRKGEAAEKYF